MFVCVRVCLCMCLCFIGCLCLVVPVVGTCGCLCGTLQGLVVSLWHFGWPWGSIVAAWASILTHMGIGKSLLGTLGRPWGFMSAPLGSIWVPLVSISVSCGHFGCGPRPLGSLLRTRLQKCTQNGSRNEDISHVFLSFRRKWQTAFGLRLCSRIRGWASRFHSLSHHWCPLFFQRFFDVF